MLVPFIFWTRTWLVRTTGKALDKPLEAVFEVRLAKVLRRRGKGLFQDFLTDNLTQL
jgi:hypothetical protein